MVRSNTGFKLAHKLARQIERDIIQLGWPVGRNLGVESDLANKYGVGRGVIRQAITLVVQSGLAEPRRGRDGGLIVTEPTRDSATLALYAYLSLHTIQIEDILDAQQQFEDLAIRLVIHRQTTSETQTLVKQRNLLISMRKEKKFQVADIGPLLGGLSRNFYLDLISTAFSQITWPYFTDKAGDPYLADRYSKLAIDLLEAVIGVKVSSALSINSSIHTLYRSAIVDGGGAISVNESNGVLEKAKMLRGRKLGEHVAIDIREKIKNGIFEAGDRIGSIVDIGEYYGVGRGVVRDAVRLLEQSGMVRAIRGKFGGVFVAQLQNESMLRTAILYLRSKNLQPRSLMEVGIVLDCFAVEKAAQRQSGRVRSSVARFKSTQTGVLRESALLRYKLISELAESPVVNLLIALQAALVDIIPSIESRANESWDSSDLSKRLFCAIEQGDVMQARNLMQQIRRQFRFRSPQLSALSEPQLLNLL